MYIRPAQEHDIQTITNIYNDAVLNTTAIWNDTTVTVDDRLAWLHHHQKKNEPVLVITNTHNHVLGFATFGPWRSFDGYRHTVEHSVYVNKTQRGQGLGRKLLTALIEEARQRNKHVMVAGIEANNTSSITLHQKMGFVQTALMPQVGIKFDTWLDLIFLQLVL